LKAYVEEDRIASRFTYAKKEGVERGKERRNGGRAIGGRGKMGRSRVEGKGERMTRGRGTGSAWAGRRWRGKEGGGEDGNGWGRVGAQSRGGEGMRRRETVGKKGRRVGGGTRGIQV